MPAAKPKSKQDTDLPEDIMDPEVAYFDSLWPSRCSKDGKEEVRRAYAMYIAAEMVMPAPDKVVPLAADIEAYLRDGRVPGRGEVSAMFTLHDDKGSVIR